MADYSDDTHWRDSSRIPRFFIMDARAAFPLIIFLMHIRWWTFWLALSATVFFGVLEHYGFTIPVFLRTIRSFLAGPFKLSQPFWRQ